MMGRKQEGDKYLQYPTLDQMEEEISRLKYRKRYGRALRGTVYSLAVVAAVAGGLCEKGKDVTVRAKGGDLIVNYTDERVTLTGDAKLVFTGEAEY